MKNKCVNLNKCDLLKSKCGIKIAPVHTVLLRNNFLIIMSNERFLYLFTRFNILLDEIENMKKLFSLP